MLITKHIEIDMSHRVPNHKSKCQNMHGHRYKVEVGVDDKLLTEGSSEGMVIDFGDIKEIMMEEIDEKFDHNGVYYENDPIVPMIMEMQEFQQKTPHFVPFIPTAENLAKYWYDLIKPRLEERGIKIKHVRIWETPTSTALYEEGSEM